MSDDRPEPLPPIAGARLEHIRVPDPGGTLYVRQSDEPSTFARLLTAS